MPNYAEYLKQ